MAEIHFGASVNADNARARRHQRRRQAAQERDKIDRIVDEIFGVAPLPLAPTTFRPAENRIEKATRLPAFREPHSEPSTAAPQRVRKRSSDTLTGRAHQKRLRFSRPLV
ncbi:hypothetical protein [Cronobacter dublinensis]|uniref:transcriptional antitermination N peptide n=1 Tax=Cronobacter dublinensis TaxID=413497 RepID=UPI0024AFF62A|nr:hypothetical protein [Cronobacter dublinensis]MDI7383633.1 hypothetical protein [Cronobacter dublinensis]